MGCMPGGTWIFTARMSGSWGASTSVFWRSTCSWPNMFCSRACWLSSSGISISSTFMWPFGSTMMFGAGARRTVTMPSLTVIFGLLRSAR